MEINLDFVIQFLGWCSVINLALLSVSAISIGLFRNQIISIHAGIFGIKEKKLPKIYFKFLANFKSFVILFNLTPYIALKIMQAG